MSLDEKICFGQGDVKDVYPEEDVKQFIQELKKKLPFCAISHNKINYNIWNIIDDLAGEGLI